MASCVPTSVEDALSATRSAIEEGIVPGGGLALLRTRESVNSLKLEGDEATGAQIIYRALEEPLRRIAANAGLEGAVVVQRAAGEKGSNGFNAATLEWEDLTKAGILDPAKVVRSALQNAASIGSFSGNCNDFGSVSRANCNGKYLAPHNGQINFQLNQVYSYEAVNDALNFLTTSTHNDEKCTVKYTIKTEVL